MLIKSLDSCWRSSNASGRWRQAMAQLVKGISFIAGLIAKLASLARQEQGRAPRRLRPGRHHAGRAPAERRFGQRLCGCGGRWFPPSTSTLDDRPSRARRRTRARRLDADQPRPVQQPQDLAQRHLPMTASGKHLPRNGQEWAYRFNRRRRIDDLLRLRQLSRSCPVSRPIHQRREQYTLRANI